MAIARDTTEKNIIPFRDATVEQGTSGAAIAAGEIVEMQSDGFWDPADASTAVIRKIGIAIQAASAAAKSIDVVVLGRVYCLTGADPGSLVYVSDTAGEPSETAGTKDTIIGFSLSTTILCVNPQIIDFS